MISFKLLIVEDDDSQLAIYESGIERYEAENGIKIKRVLAKTLNKALDVLDNTFDAAIIDLKLNSDVEGGNKLAEKINRSFRIPVIIITATPANIDVDRLNIYKQYVRGHDIQEVLSDLHDLYNTGITKIIGGRGQIENAMNEIFWNNILPQVDSWKQHSALGKDTEKALLRSTINHLLEFLDYDSDLCFPEEMYIFPAISKRFKTGSIVKKNDTNDYYVILSPSCDLAIHNGNIKTDRILTCCIEKQSISLIKKAKANSKLKVKGRGKPRKAIEDKIEKANALLNRISRNNYSSYYHFLPQTNAFDGGLINFRKINTSKPRDFSCQFTKPLIQISSHFTKDIVARFSSYYARQGQPDLDATLANV